MSSDDLHHADPASAEDGVPGTLAGLITQCAKGVTRWDEDFARAVAASLHARSEHLTFPEVDAMGLEEVVITFYMDRELRDLDHRRASPRLGAAGPHTMPRDRRGRRDLPSRRRRSGSVCGP
jgi:hypothetical protein